MQFLKKSTLGRLITADGGLNDPELAEVRFTAEEFRAVCAEFQVLNSCKKELEQEVESQRLNMQATMKTQKESCKRILQQRQEEFNRIREELESENARLMIENTEKQRDLEAQKNLNWNLKRILREKANAKRGLIPKKLHSGYSVLFSSQYKERYCVNMKRKTVNTWKSVIQTYYDATMPLVDVEKDIWTELTGSVLSSMGIKAIRSLEKRGNDILEEKNECILYRCEYKANYSSGFWEIAIWTTQALDMTEENC